MIKWVISFKKHSLKLGIILFVHVSLLVIGQLYAFFQLSSFHYIGFWKRIKTGKRIKYLIIVMLIESFSWLIRTKKCNALNIQCIVYDKLSQWSTLLYTHILNIVVFRHARNVTYYTTGCKFLLKLKSFIFFSHL